MDKEKKKTKLPATTVGFMVGVALLFDTVDALLTFTVVGVPLIYITLMYAWLTFTIWFWMRGVSFMSTKKLATMAGALLAKFIPGFSALPAWTAFVLITVAIIRGEELLEKVAGALPVGGEAVKGAIKKKLGGAGDGGSGTTEASPQVGPMAMATA